jgi:hypothetical protein
LSHAERVNQDPGRTLPDRHRDKLYAIGFIVVFVPVLAALGLLLLGPMRGQREAFFAGLAIMGSVPLAGYSQRKKRRVRRKPGFRDAMRKSALNPVEQIGGFALIFAVLVLIPRITGQASWSAILGMLAGLAVLFVGIGLSWIFGKRPSYGSS